jgi:hypothetical protein
MTKGRPPRLAPAASLSSVVAAGLLALALAGCGSNSSHLAGSTSAAPATSSTTTPAPSTTLALATTAPDCGAGAYKPRTLLIVCGVEPKAVSATDVVWTSWGSATATGAGTVHLYLSGRSVAAPGRFLLEDPATGSLGPQFRRLVVTWTGPSPDGRSRDTFALGVGS